MKISKPTPPPANLGSFIQGYIAGQSAADSTNRIVFAEFPCFSTQASASPLVQLAAYTADATGNLTTTDTYAAMPTA